MTAPGVLLISPGIIRWTDMDFGLPHLVSIGGWLRAKTGVRVEVLDLNYEGGDHHELLRVVDSLGPHLVIGLSAYSSFDYVRVMALARFLRARFPDVPLVAGGYHASALPDDIVFDGSPFDAVVIGEAELPMQEIVEALIGGNRLDKRIYGPATVAELDDLPPYAWDLLDRYWPRALSIGRKMQVYLSRGCPYHCTFCMERAKSGYSWRAYSPDRAIDELRRLAARTDLSQWVVNLADPLFGFRRRWRVSVLEGIVRHGIAPRQFWTLTRSDDLDDDDVSLLARARFSIGIGLESGSPTMLRRMQKGNNPHQYLDAMRRLAALARRHGLNWAANVIVGHPGETRESMEETHAFLTELFLAAPETCGWLSVDPFRLYPGADVFVSRPRWEQETGARFHHTTWWKSWYDGAFWAQFVEPSSSLSYDERVRFMYDRYGPLVAQVQHKFRGQGRSVDRVFARSLAEQAKQLSPSVRDELLLKAERARSSTAQSRAEPSVLSLPIGLHVRDPWVRQREDAVRRLLDLGVLRTTDLIEALLQVGPESFMDDKAARAVLTSEVRVEEGALPPALGLGAIALGLEALEPALGDAIADLTARSGYLAALLSRLVGPTGSIRAVHPGGGIDAVRGSLAAYSNVAVVRGDERRVIALDGIWDGIWLGAAVPRIPRYLQMHLRESGGRAILFVGPRFRAQELVSMTRHGESVEHRFAARVRVPVLGGSGGWVPARTAEAGEGPVAIECWTAPAVAFRVLAHLDLGADAASCFDPELPKKPWVAPLLEAYLAAPGRESVQFAALSVRDVPSLVARLRETPPKALRDAPGQRLAGLFADAIEFEAAEHPADGVSVSAPPFVGALQRIREALWAPQGRVAPRLRVLHVPALGRYGRGATIDGVRVVAVSLHQPSEHAFCQILHEEIHPITDPIVRAGRLDQRDTRIGSDGFDLHAELERVAMQATEAFLEARAPEWLPAFRRWSAKFAAYI